MTEIEQLVEATERGDCERVRAILASHPELVSVQDGSGATALHHAAFQGRREVVALLVELGADVNARDSQFRATPAGWAIEYLRECGGFLGIEIEDLAHAIRTGDVGWAERFVTRFPGLRNAVAADGVPVRQLAMESGNAGIARLFEIARVPKGK